MHSLVKILALVGLGLCNPVPLYQYSSGGLQVRTANATKPIMFNGIAIGTTELHATAASGAIHSLADGHHFYHRDWFLSSDNGTCWKYLPSLRASLDAKSSVNKRRQIGEAPADRVLFTSFTIDQFDPQPFFQYEEILTDTFVFTSDFGYDSLWGISYDGITGPFEAFDLIADSVAVASTSSVFADFANIFFNALEIFS